MQTATDSPTISTIPSGVRRGLAGFFLSGLIYAFLGAILPAWGYHLSSDYDHIGLFFLVINGGVLLAVQASRWWLKRVSPKAIIVSATGLAAIAFAGMIFAAPPAPTLWRQAALLALGFAEGLMNAGFFRLVAPAYERAAALTANLAGILFGAGSILASSFLAGSVDGYPLWLPVAGFSALAFGYAVWFFRGTFPVTVDSLTPVGPTIASDSYSPAAILMTLVLFVQFGNEWSVAGWLPLLLIQRLGMSPQSALWLLATYWLAIVVGRLLARSLLRRFRHSRILMSSVISAALGCLILGVTDSRFGAGVAVLLIGGGFAMIYPLMLEMVGQRFPHYHPVYFNGIFTLALTGGLLAPWIVGLVTSAYGIGLATLIPFMGTVVVFLLLALIRLEAKLNPPE